jgi:hypothetical protein
VTFFDVSYTQTGFGYFFDNESCFPQPNTRPLAVSLDKNAAYRLKGPPYVHDRPVIRHPIRRLEFSKSGAGNLGGSGELTLRPCDESACGSALIWRNAHLQTLYKMS